jgi:hypothetical protein
MSASPDILRQFMIGLGFKIDESGMKKFARSIAVQTEVVRELADGLKEAAVKVVEFARNTAEAMDQLYFASQRVKASAGNLQALSYAAKQSGVSVESMSSAIESLNKFLTTTPNGRTLLNNIGVSTEDSNGKLRDTTDILKDLKRSLSEMPAYRANSYAEMFGIDWKLLNASTDAIDKFSDEYKAMAKSLGLNTDSAVQSGNKFQTTLRRMRGWLELLGEKAGSELANKLQEPLDRLSNWLIKHGPDISNLIDKIIDALSRMLPVLLSLGETGAKYLGELIHWFNNLPKPVKVVLGVLLALVPVAAALAAGIVALGAVITAFGTIVDVASVALGAMGVAMDVALGPIGLVAAAIAGLIADFEHWKKTGKSFLPWDKWKPEIDSAIAGVKKFAGTVADKLGLHFGPSDPRGLRNNNPGNIEYGQFAKAHGATGVESQGRFALFDSAQAGLNALAALLRKYGNQGIDTVRGIISKYAPASDGNPASYMASVAKKLGVGLDSKLNLSDAGVLSGLMGSIVQFENGRNPYSGEMLSLAAKTALGGGAPNITIHQTNTATVSGSSDPVTAGREVGKAFTKNSSDLIRGLQARVS